MDKTIIREWHEFCDGNASHAPEDFSTLFMEIYLEPKTKEDEDYLKAIFRPIPNSSSALDKLIRLYEPAPFQTEVEISEAVKRDINAMRPLITSHDVLKAMESRIEITLDENDFHKKSDSQINLKLIHAIADYSMKQIVDQSKPIQALSKAFFGIAHNLHLQCALTADLVPGMISFENYFELYYIGVDYALGANEVTAINYRG